MSIIKTILVILSILFTIILGSILYLLVKKCPDQLVFAAGGAFGIGCATLLLYVFKGNRL